MEDGHPSMDVVRYETPAAAHRLLGLCCTGYGATARKTITCGPRTLESYAAVYVSAGSGWIETATTGRARIEGPALVWLFPGVAHTYAPDNAGWTEQWVMFEGMLPETFARLGFLSPARPVSDGGDVLEIAALFARMRADFLTGGPLAGIRAATLVQRLIIVAHGADHSSAADDTGSSADLRRALARFEERALQPLDFATIARDSNMGYSTLRRRFKEATGYSPKEYVLRTRLTRAKEALTLTAQSVDEIAHAVGFGDPYYFSRLFHTKEGLSPTQFRAQQQSDRRGKS